MILLLLLMIEHFSMKLNEWFCWYLNVPAILCK
jgi:hypothetical protein